MDISEYYVTCMDILEAYDTYEYFIIRFKEYCELMESYPYPKAFLGLNKLKEWNNKISKAKATDKINVDDKAQLKVDLETVYRDFQKLIT